MDADVPWNRQPGEPLHLFAVFDHFRLMGGQRTVEVAWRRSQADKGRQIEPGEHRCPSNLRAAAVKWRWVERAESWDLDEIARKRREHAEAAEASKTQRLALLGRALERLEEALYISDVSRMKMGEVVNAIRMVTTELRIEYGQQSAGQFAITEEEADLAIERALAELSARNQDAALGDFAD